MLPLGYRGMLSGLQGEILILTRRYRGRYSPRCPVSDSVYNPILTQSNHGTIKSLKIRKKPKNQLSQPKVTRRNTTAITSKPPKKGYLGRISALGTPYTSTAQAPNNKHKAQEKRANKKHRAKPHYELTNP